MFIINYIINLDENKEAIVQKMLFDMQFWPGCKPPRSINQLVSWAIDDYIDYYKSFSKRK
ncbi:hypothetical protein BFD03_01895 [Limosilactobacillus reuteri]|uniref:Uncharacterized protein n=1 Tax=Limosilactobacillus reuteri TaxID=1598 RepID=A0A079YVZ7_LIMRT|nr:hypothetical protein HQ33_08250 [Limosilactobacillus reuteri]PEG79969.1 hypothetical protein CP369_03780 [Lactobacillus sp. UMNPBX18]MCT3199727.1 hypothetical protein [Limosilactobacillus reuteri]OCX49696.1 hypothetical protein BFD03_01895 [Limosilactobacillus reuteri]PTV05290.1 hypothetical protein DB325_00890 [Limosilactobacillus reuteri]